MMGEVVQVEQIAPDGVLTGELLMVNGQALLTRDFEEQGVDIEPLIQAPSLMLQLAYAMLNRSQPRGPYAVNEKQYWDETEKAIDFQLNTGLATGTSFCGATVSVTKATLETEPLASRIV